MTRPRITFLPAFFVCLAIVFAVAVWLRLRSYDKEAPRPAETASVEQKQAGSSSAPAPKIIETVSENATAPPPISSVATERARRRAAQPDLTPLLTAPRSAQSKTARAAQVAPPPKPSLFSRLVSPIVNAITGGGKPAAGTNPQQASQVTGSSGHPGSTSTSGTANDPAKNDPNSDTVPPQLLSATFVPPQVRDGEQTVLTIQATDDLSGIRSISGTILSPSGGVQGFACQRQDPTTFTATINVPKEAAEGFWRINYLSLIDNASNAATLSSARGGLPADAGFRVVSSAPDSKGPVLKAVWVDRPGMKAGEKNMVFVDAEDDKSGVALVSGVFISPTKHARIGFVCRAAGGGPWQGELTTPACIDCGEWQLEQVQLQDNANNMTTVRSDNPLLANVRVSITADRCDMTAPNLQSVALDRNVVSNAQDSIITVTAVGSDDVCGIMSMSGQVTGPATAGGAPRLYFSFTPSGDNMTWTGRITVPKLAAKGTWRVSWIQVLDQGHNLRTYSQGDPVLATAVFNVE